MSRTVDSEAESIQLRTDSQTLSTVWEVALTQLSGSSSTLQKMLSFFDPDKIHESILRLNGDGEENGAFRFLDNDMEYVFPCNMLYPS